MKADVGDGHGHSPVAWEALAQTGRRFSGEPSGEPWVTEAP